MKLPYNFQLVWRQALLAFLLGAVCGAFVYSQFVFSRHLGWRGNPERFHERRMREFNVRLKLTPEQQTAVKAITDKARLEMDALRIETRPRLDAIRQETEARIREALDPSQQVAFDKMNTERKSYFEKKFKQSPYGKRPGGGSF